MTKLTTEDVRESFILDAEDRCQKPRGKCDHGADFDAWLADIIQKAKDEAYEDMSHNLGY